MAGQRKVYLNGSYVSEREANVSIFDSALMFGDMVFEVTRTYNGVPFRLREHMERLYAGLKILEIDCGLTVDQMEQATIDLVEANRDTFDPGIDMQIMHNVSRGALGLYASVFDGKLNPTVVINCWPLTQKVGGVAGKYKTGIHAITPAQRSVPARLIDPKIKNRSRIYYQVANLEVQKADPAAWPLLVDDDGFITEGTGFNFFLIKDGVLLTSEPRNILRGVTRALILNLAREAGIPVVERNLDTYEVHTADEAFFTATSFAILPVTRYNFRTVADGNPGPITRRLTQAWSAMVGLDVVAQASHFAEVAAREAAEHEAAARTGARS